MNWVDMGILALLLVGLILGIKNGFIWQLCILVMVVVGFFAAAHFLPPVANFLSKIIPNRDAAKVIAFFAIFIGVIVVFILPARLIQKAVRAAKLTTLDRVLGGLLGLVKAAVFCATLLLVAVHLSPQRPQAPIANSKLAPYFLRSVKVASPLIGEETKTKLEIYLHRLGQEMERIFKYEPKRKRR